MPAGHAAPLGMHIMSCGPAESHPEGATHSVLVKRRPWWLMQQTREPASPPQNVGESHAIATAVGGHCSRREQCRAPVENTPVRLDASEGSAQQISGSTHVASPHGTPPAPPSRAPPSAKEASAALP